MEVDKEQLAADIVLSELRKAQAKFAPFYSGHEGYAVILEELDELWHEVKNNKGQNYIEQCKEAMQVAAMALRFMVDVIPEPALTYVAEQRMGARCRDEASGSAS